MPGVAAGEAMRRLARAFEAAKLETPSLDARLLVMAAMGMTREQLVAEPERPVDPQAGAKLDDYRLRRLGREPVSRIIGRRAFHGLVLEITPATLDPRADTETLVDGVLELYGNGELTGGSSPRILDLGTGTGAILIALLKALPAATGVATDISSAALAVAERNAAAARVGQRMTTRETSWLTGIERPFDLVVSNPPYIAEGEAPTLAPEDNWFDPALALFAGADGLDAYRAILTDVSRVLGPGGWLVLEVGAGQAQAVARLCRDTGSLKVEIAPKRWTDLGGHERCVAAKSLC
jgi:release factor glutamine methyltransferase